MYTIVEAEITLEAFNYIKQQADAKGMSVEAYIEEILEKLKSA